jgi:bisphosphoglycerate-dependent phosphoglycerate mutase
VGLYSRAEEPRLVEAEKDFSSVLRLAPGKKSWVDERINEAKRQYRVPPTSLALESRRPRKRGLRYKAHRKEKILTLFCSLLCLPALP